MLNSEQLIDLCCRKLKVKFNLHNIPILLVKLQRVSVLQMISITVWVLSVPACAGMKDAMQQSTAVQHMTSKEHKVVGSTC